MATHLLYFADLQWRVDQPPVHGVCGVLSLLAQVQSLWSK